MTRRALCTFSLVLLLGCGFGQVPDDPYAAPLTPPWIALGLPLDGGRVLYSDEILLTAHFEAADRAAIGAAMTAALTAAGYSLQADTSAGDMTSITFTGEAEVLALGVLKQGGVVQVNLTRYDK